MKKTLCTLLALVMLVAMVALPLTSCNLGSSAAIIPDGYQKFENDSISFAYPEDWIKTESSVVILSTPDGIGNNITVAYEVKSDLYSTMTASSFVTTFQPSLEVYGMSVQDVAVEQKKNGAGIPITQITYTTTMNGISMDQTLFVVASGNRNYIVTITETTADRELVETVFETLRT